MHGEGSLQAYSKAFDFVEVNSTYYELIGLDTLKRWIGDVPGGFEFSVRCNRSLLDLYYPRNTGGEEKRERFLASVEQTCNVLGASFITVLMNNCGVGAVSGLSRFCSDFHATVTRVAVELRGARASREFLRVLEVNDAIHCVDISKDESPEVGSGVLYTRLFGRGEGNVYEFEDDELKKILAKAESPKFEKSILAFHGVRMYRDAARLKTFSATGEFPRLTDSTGLDALQKVLEEDAAFPATGRELLTRQGWKLFDYDEKSRVRAERLLKKLPADNIFASPRDVREALEPITRVELLNG